MISMISTPNVTHVTHFQVRLRARTYGGYTAQTSHASRPAVPFCPGCGTYLADAEALAEWRRVAPTLERLDLLKPEDRALLSAYCETWSVYVAAVQRVRAEGLTITSPKSGVVHRNPAVTVAETARMHLLRLASEFGLTPAAEQRLAVAPGDDGDGLNPFAPDR